MEWWLNDKRHREDGPAVEDTDGNKEWWVDGGLHREDGPAIDEIDGEKQWWVHNHIVRIEPHDVERMWSSIEEQHLSMDLA